MVEAQENFVDYKVEKKPGCVVSLTVTAHGALLQKAKTQALKEVKKSVSIPGFRKGKAPDSMVEKKHASAIHTSFREILADLSYKEAQKKAQIRLLNGSSRISFHMNSLEKEKAELQFEFETEPEIPSIDPSQFTLTKVEKKTIGEKEVEEAVRQSRFFFAKWTTITDRPVKEGDHLIIDLETLEEPIQKVFTNTRFEAQKKYMAPWMLKMVIGKNTGDVLEGESKPDPKDPEAKGLGKKKVRLTIRKIEKAELPEVNEELAKKMGTKSVEDLYTETEKMLKSKAEEQYEQALKDQANAFFLSFDFEVPASVLDAENKHRLNHLQENPKEKERFASLSPEEKKQVEERLKQEALEALKLYYISGKIVQEQNMPVTEQEILEEAKKTLKGYGPLQFSLDQLPKEFYTLCFSKVILRKAQDFLLAKTEKKA